VTDFLYPFIDGNERDVGDLLADLASSAEAKARLSDTLRRNTLAALDYQLDAAAAAMAERFTRGGRLFTFGNGGSSTDAAGAVAIFGRPSSGRPLSAMSLVADHAVLSALANDVGYELVFSRQLIAFAKPADIAFGLSTSGNSSNLLHAFAEASRRGLLTVGLAGYSGGKMSEPGVVDHCLVVHSDSVHRIQETQNAILFDLWARVQRHLIERTKHER
jgi:D-sedoheptulose 7-phosphate isomerase